MTGHGDAAPTQEDGGLTRHREAVRALINAFLPVVALPVAGEADNTLGYAAGTAAELLRDLEGRIEADRFIVTVAGEFSSGKSSLLNVLLDATAPNKRDRPQGMLPTDIRATTATVTRIEYGEERPPRVRVRMRNGQVSDYRGADSIARFGAIRHTGIFKEDPSRTVEQVTVWCPSPLLADGVVMVDTPGLGSVIEAHRVVTTRFIPRSDAVLFLIDSGSPLTEREKTFLQYVRGYTKNFFFVQTKIDSEDRQELDRVTGEMQATWRKTMRHNLTHLGEVIGKGGVDDDRYFPVSAHRAVQGQRLRDEAQITDSGIPALRAALLAFLIDQRGRPRLLQHGRRADAVLLQVEQRIVALLGEMKSRLPDGEHEAAERKVEQDAQAANLVRGFLESRDAALREEARANALGKSEETVNRTVSVALQTVRSLGGPEGMRRGRTPNLEKFARFERSVVQELQAGLRVRVEPVLRAALEAYTQEAADSLRSLLTHGPVALSHLDQSGALFGEDPATPDLSGVLLTETVERTQEISERGSDNTAAGAGVGTVTGAVLALFGGPIVWVMAAVGGALVGNLIDEGNRNVRTQTHTEEVTRLDEGTLRTQIRNAVEAATETSLRHLRQRLGLHKTTALAEVDRLEAEIHAHREAVRAMKRQSEEARAAQETSLKEQIEVIRNARNAIAAWQRGMAAGHIGGSDRD